VLPSLSSPLLSSPLLIFPSTNASLEAPILLEFSLAQLL
jgi:hypothetical protein